MIEFEFKLTKFYTRYPCTVCGGRTEKVNVLTEATPWETATEDVVIRVCETCLEEGNIDERLKQHAHRLEADAALARELIGQIKVPSHAEWQAAENRADVAHYAQDVTKSGETFDHIMKDDAFYATWREAHDRSVERTQTRQTAKEAGDLPF